MAKYILKRLVYLVGIFFLVSVIMFVLFDNVPGDRAMVQVQNMRGKVTNEQFEQLYLAAREKLGLDDPTPVRYCKWIQNLAKGDLGYSTTYNQEVKKILGRPLANTIFINVIATFVALIITIPLGIFCAVRKHTRLDNVIQVLTVVGYGVPSFITALLFVYIFAVRLQLFPINGMNTPNFQGSELEYLVDRLYHLALPVLVMTVASLGGMTRYVRAAMIDALRMDYIRTARSKGLSEKVVIYSHAWRNALLPVVTLIIGWFMSIFMGSIVIEQMFQINGIGYLYYLCLTNQDYDVALAVNMLYCGISLLSNLITDLSYGLVDPRVRINK